MKRFFLIIISLCAFNINLFSYPQAELGLISNYNLPEKRMAPLRQGPGGFGQRSQPKINLIKEKRKDGSDSLVFKVEHLPQFLFLSTMQAKPVVVGFFSGDDDTLMYQGIADKLKDAAVFVSVYPQNSPDLANLFSMILKFEGLDSVLGGNKKYPFFLFCNRDFVLLQDRSVSFKKKSVKLLAKPGDFSEKSLLRDISKNAQKTCLNESISTENAQKQEKQTEKSSVWRSYKEKFKKWLNRK